MTTTSHAALGRRAALGGLIGGAALALAPRRAAAQAAAPSGPFSLPALPYAPGALEPHIDQRTMELHHGAHHRAFVTNLNNAAREHSRLGETPLHELLGRLGEMPEGVRNTVRNSGGGHANHTMFWEVMGPQGGAPSGDLAAAIQRDLGGVDKMKTDFNAAGAGQFGSGWVFVTVDGEGKLGIATRPNQDSPLFDGQRALFGNDVWEHAYYLKYQNRRAEYLQSWWNVVNWTKVGERYAAARAGRLAV